MCYNSGMKLTRCRLVFAALAVAGSISMFAKPSPQVAIRFQSWETKPAERPVDTNEVVVVPPKGMKIFLLMGQSNMAGRGRVPAEWRRPLARAYKMNRDGAWTAATSPLHFDRRSSGVGPGDMFLRRYLEDHPGETAGVVPCAVGGSGIPTWTPAAGDGPEGQNFRRALARAKKAQETGEIVCMLWLQGETDARRYHLSPPDFEAYYVPRFTNMVATLRRELGLPDLPVLASEAGTFVPDIQERLNPAIAAAVRTLPRCALVPAADLSTCLPDKIHFDTAAQRTLGVRYYDAFRKMVR